MSVSSPRIITGVVSLALLSLTACSSSVPVRVGTQEFYWSAARETYAAGDYRKTADHLEKLIEANDSYAARAVPWYLVLTSGMAAGYMDLADNYTAGARRSKANALAFRLKATEYRTASSRLALRFAQNVDKIDRVPLGTMPLAFPLPNGNAAQPALLSRIASGIEITPADALAAEALTIQHSVLMTVCLAAGSPNDVAKAEEIFGRPSSGTSRAIFGQAIAHLLETESTLYTRDKLDDPEKLSAFRQRAQNVLAEANRAGSARVVQIGAVTTARP
jgi:hypothetical protein